ncbi:hypothetical protein SAMN04489716_8299 [Actinoplanes derwentensis]|uniref:Uncharacterized protein n=1 Tax=Actinoplanes derwentensis TaxID=113562 RepID=A0A1H2D698_9ACTN|nr:hypothetical protein Ade03nite_45160 [Actinoplanes derwentensis]SDT78263.1 hypothetical protein SAMN04489716_8299 [Actinoplanes derwentensis]
MDDRFRVDFRRGLLVGLIAVSVVAFLAGLAVRAWAGETGARPAPATDRSVINSRMGERPAVERLPDVSRPTAPATEDCPAWSSPAAER